MPSEDFRGCVDGAVQSPLRADRLRAPNGVKRGDVVKWCKSSTDEMNLSERPCEEMRGELGRLRFFDIFF